MDWKCGDATFSSIEWILQQSPAAMLSVIPSMPVLSWHLRCRSALEACPEKLVVVTICSSPQIINRW